MMATLMVADLAKDYLAGVAGGVAVVLIGHPFDTVKTRLQTSPIGIYRGTIDCVKKTFRQEGAKGFYSGIESPLLGQMFFRASSFATFFCSLKLITNNSHKPAASQYFLAGATTGFFISFIETPIDLVKTKLQIQVFAHKFDSTYKPQYKSVYCCVRHLVTAHGVTSLWQGTGATMMRNVPANAMFFPVNEIMKQNVADYNNKSVDKLTMPERLFAGACAGLSYWVGTFPLDAIKARVQALPYEQRQGWLKTAAIIYREGGIRAFARGLAPSAARSVPACASMFATVDIVRYQLGRYI